MYFLFDANGYLAPGPTVPAWRDAADLLQGDAGRQLVEDGSTDDPAALAREIRDLLETLTGPAVLVLRALQQAAERADTVLVMSDGVVGP